MSAPKYVVFKSRHDEIMVCFPAIMIHKTVAMWMGTCIHRHNHIDGDFKPISAGFISGGRCFGESESLNLKSRGPVDDALALTMVGIAPLESAR